MSKGANSGGSIVKKRALLTTLASAALWSCSWRNAAAQYVTQPLPPDIRIASPFQPSQGIPVPIHPGAVSAATPVVHQTAPAPGDPLLSPPMPQVVNPPVPMPCSTGECADAAPPPAPFEWSKFRLGGQYRIEGNADNFNFHHAVITDSQKDQFFVNQRLRLWLTYNPTDNVEGYIQMQVGGINWGTDFDFNKNFGANFPPNPNDVLGIQLRRAWLSAKDDCWGKFRAGILDWHDYFGDTLASSDYDFNTGGIEWTNKFKDWNDFEVRAAMLLLTDAAFIVGGPAEPGAHSAYLFAIDGDQPVGPKSSIGASVYYLTDRGQYSYPTFIPYADSWDLWFGVRGKTEINCMPVNGFFIVNTGERHDYTPGTDLNHTGYAGKAEIGPVPIGPGKFSAQAVASSGSSNPGSGDDSEFRTVAQSQRDNFGAQGYWSYMHITTPNGPDDVNDLGVSLQNRGFGLFTVQAKYDLPLAKKLLSTSAVGWLRSTKSNNVSGSSDMGTELAQQFTYDFGGGLKLDFGISVLFTGDFYRAGPAGPNPDNLYETFARLQLEF